MSLVSYTALLICMPCVREDDDDDEEEEVRTYLDVCLKTPGLPEEDMNKALLAQHNVRELGKGRLQPDPSNASGQPSCKDVSSTTATKHIVS